ncbi:fibronectin type III domain-containing protein [Halorussus amylolyticus]|uniref:fibronectin type III domain-containing protein n=1 Tax=Halorussus amylolyticus TaxID=1126242 RepID=UPI001045BC7A|nr:fibronectin type III domain-containing protein [Halorussus amylolyticus]
MARDEAAREQRVDRRTYLKLAGAGVVSAAAGGAATQTVAAAPTAGYGAGGFGVGGYGVAESTPPSVTALSASSVEQTEATLGGSLVDLGGADSATVYFEYRATGASGWTETDGQTRTSTRTFYRTVDGLNADTDYEFRAVAEASDGDIDTSESETFATDWNTLVIDGSDAPQSTSSYSFAVDGEVEKSGSLGSIQSNDVISDGNVSGEVGEGTDAYRFTGDIEWFHVFGSPSVSLNDESVDLGDLGDEPPLPNSVVIDGSNRPNAKSSYTLEFSGAVAKAGELGSIQSDDVIDGSTVTGTVVGGKDAYRYSGDITRVEISGPAVFEIEDNDG